jgi:hypothetical protein
VAIRQDLPTHSVRNRNETEKNSGGSGTEKTRPGVSVEQESRSSRGAPRAKRGVGRRTRGWRIREEVKRRVRPAVSRLRTDQSETKLGETLREERLEKQQRGAAHGGEITAAAICFGREKPNQKSRRTRRRMLAMRARIRGLTRRPDKPTHRQAHVTAEAQTTGPRVDALRETKRRTNQRLRVRTRRQKQEPKKKSRS